MSQSEGVKVHALEAFLSEVVSSPEMIGTALVDGTTGLTYGVAGSSEVLGAGSELSELVTLITDRLNAAGAIGELESVVVTSTSRHHVTQVVERQGDPLLLTAVLDRERTNLALAMRQMAEHARNVLA